MIIILYKRKPCIYQTQLTDFIGLGSVEKYDMNIPRDYRIARKKFRWIPIHPKWGRRSRVVQNPLYKNQKTILDFIPSHLRLNGRYIYRFPDVKIPRFEDFVLRTISKKEWDMHRYLCGFNGFFENLFEFNDFSFFREKQEELEKRGPHLKTCFWKM
ncbi:MAG: hypothetical protein ACTSQS_18995 [Promethearchaeota archaeon]